MLRVRIFEEIVAELLESNEIKCPTHLYIGQEAVAVGVCAALERQDYVWGTHRSHGHYIAKGGDMAKMMAELFGKETGCSLGRGGSMHLFAPEVGILGTVPLVSATIPIAVGAALACSLRGESRVSVAFFGDGAVEEGTTHEALNFAALKRLPVVFVCENNFFSSHLPLLARRAADNIVDAAKAHSMRGVRVDGNDVLAMLLAASTAVEQARSGGGPTLIECRTYRWRGHVGPRWDLDVGIRDKAELESWMAKCPVKRIEQYMLQAGILAEKEIAASYTRTEEEVRDCVQFARQSPYPNPQDVAVHVLEDRQE
jgi:pyruvate dehydrogenase E1 component alpha subunit